MKVVRRNVTPLYFSGNITILFVILFIPDVGMCGMAIVAKTNWVLFFPKLKDRALLYRACTVWGMSQIFFFQILF